MELSVQSLITQSRYNHERVVTDIDSHDDVFVILHPKTYSKFLYVTNNIIKKLIVAFIIFFCDF